MIHQNLYQDKETSSFEDAVLLGEDQPKKKIDRKTLLIILISCIAAVVVILVVVLSVVLTRKKSKKVPERQITFSGVDNSEILQGKFFNCFDGVTALSNFGEDYTPKISVSGAINTAKVGDYILNYSVVDVDGKKFEKARSIKVKKNSYIGIEKPIPIFSIENGATFDIAKGCKTTSNSGQQDVSKVVDGDMKTRWESQHGVDDVFLMIDLGYALEVNQINIFWEAAFAVSFEVQISNDASSWEAIEKVSNPTDMESETIDGQKVYPNRFSYDKISRRVVVARYIRIQCFKRVSNYGYSIFEVEVIGPKGTVVPTEYYQDLFDAKNDRSKDWPRPNSQWVKFDLDTVQSVDTIRIAFQNYVFPQKYNVMYSTDDSNYNTIILKNLPYSGDTFSIHESQEGEKITVSARYFKIEMESLKFFASCYRIVEVNFKLGDQSIDVVRGSASSSKADHGIELAFDKQDSTYWENDNNVQYQTIDLNEVKNVGRVDLYWRGDDGGKGKYYDLEISSDGSSWTKVFRQVHGATPLQKIYVYRSCRYIRIIDYQSPNTYQYMIEGAVVHPAYPSSSGEGPVDYDVAAKFPEFSIVNHGNGSYVTGGTEFPSSRLIAFLDDSLRSKPVPSNGWWQGLLVKDKGYNMYTNPLIARFKNDGLWLSNPGAGYYDGLVPGTGSQTIDTEAFDVCIGYKDLSDDAEVRVTSYSDFGVSAVMSDDINVDKLTVFISQGSLYAYCFFAEPEKAMIKADTLVSIFDLSGNQILQQDGQTFKGDSIVVLARTHSGFVGGVNKHYETDSSGNKVVVDNEKIYEERYYVISVPEESEFTRKELNIFVNMINGNYLSVGAVSQKNQVKQDGSSISDKKPFPKEEIELIHQHGYAFVIDTSCVYSFDNETNNVTTEFNMKALLLRPSYSNQVHSAFLPHHIEHSTYKEGYIYPSVRGNCHSYTGNSFVTNDTFHGIVPTFSEPTCSGYDINSLNDLIRVIYNHNGGDKPPEQCNLISGDPYWQGKNLHPMTMAALVSDQIGATNLRDKFLDKIAYILSDWFNYNKEAGDESSGAYFYYDKEWGTLYYKFSEFGAGVNLADHYFTYGYYLLAAGVLSSYRPSFAEHYKDMIELLIRDYMNPSHNDTMFPYMRNFDCFAGHGWAGGYADNNGGNNQESAGEALNSWVGAYFYACATGNEEIKKAAICGYTTELSATKHYWFNYFGDFLSSYPYGGTGQVYGGSSFYGTFFNGEPLYVYGIHLIPGQEYLTSLALNNNERKALSNAIQKLKYEQSIWDVSEDSKNLHAWQHIFIPIIAIYNPDEAIQWYNDCIKTLGGIGNDQEQYNVYWIMYGLKSIGFRTTEIWTQNAEPATIYIKDGAYKALCWNPTQEIKTYVFKNKEGVTGSAVVPPKTLITVDPTVETTSILKYFDDSDFTLDLANEVENAEVNENSISFKENGRVSYLLTFGETQVYRSANIKCSNGGSDLKLFIDDKEIQLTKKNDVYESEPFSATFKHVVTLRGNKINVNEFKFVQLTLVKSNVKMTGSASSVNGNENTADKAVDGNIETRWESKFEEPVFFYANLEQQTLVYQLQIHWEAASAKEYKVYFSNDGNNWIEVGHVVSNQGKRTDYINPSTVMRIGFIKIECISRTTNYGFSIYEIEIYNF